MASTGRRTGVWILAGLSAAVLLHVVAGSFSSVIYAQDGNTSFTEAEAHTEVIRETVATVRGADQLATRIVGRVGSTIVYDQTFPLPFGHPAVQTAVAEAAAAVAAAVPPGVPISGPDLVSTTETLAGTSSSSVDDPFYWIAFQVTETIGPAVVQTGDLDPCVLDPAPAAPPAPPYAGCTAGGGSGDSAEDPAGYTCAPFPPLSCTGGVPFTVNAGTVNFNFLTLLHRDVARETTVTETFLVSSLYEISAPIEIPTVSQWALMILGLVLAAAGIRALRA